MGNYDFTGLSTGSFESLAQALAIKVLGPGTIVFGAGPDGGREATYEGRVNYPSTAEPWDGYIVLQAKFRQRLTDRETDAEWATNLLRDELDKYVERKGGRRVPDYYIFVTNVILTPMQDRGGKDQVARVFEEYRDRLPLRSWGIWDYDQLSTFLDADESVRSAFTAFITAGDVLAEAMKRLRPSRADFEEVMTSYLSRELNNSKHAVLEQASVDRILLSSVFVDLPLHEQRLAEPPDETEKPMEGVVATIIAAARERLDGPTRVTRAAGNDPVAARYVIVGGPGQGKTTVGQFACQLFRAAILQDRRSKLAEEVLTALDEMRTISEREEIDLPRARRFPLHVVLRDFATALSRRKSAIAAGQALREMTLFSYLTERIADRTSREVTADDFREWLRAYPWLLVLDGLDEVPSASNRSDVLQAIEEFWMEASQANADLLMIATTRPQDYQDDFSPSYYVHRWLVPLSPERALRYGKRLLEIRHGVESDRSVELLQRMEKAAAAESTARLMRSPLQVTIMATLVEQIGTPPQDRWRLFREYYNAIYRRERERTPSELLGKYESDINAIHHRTGLELQIMSESSGQTEARLSRKQFESIVRDRLEDQGHEGPALERLMKEIVDAAALRLVFIVGLDVDSVGFEIRSLQEFMAAEALLGLGGDTGMMQNRLRAIAEVQSWRNVFIFAAGRCFAEMESLIDTIHAICRELNRETSAVATATQQGSMLALELLEDAAVSPKPKHARLLAETALELLSAPPSEIHDRLAAAHSEAVDKLYREELTRQLEVAAIGDQIGAWRTLMHLIERHVTWAEGMAEMYWPKNADRAFEILAPMRTSWTSWLHERTRQILHRLPLQKVTRLLVFWHTESRSSWATIASPIIGGYSEWLETAVRVTGLEKAGFQLSLRSLGGFESLPRQDVPPVEEAHPSWQPLLRFIASGTAVTARSVATLLDDVRTLALTADSQMEFMWRLPWPARVMLEGATEESLLERANALHRGEYGDRAEWLEAEARWTKQAVDFNELSDTVLPMSHSIARHGYPYQVAEISISSPEEAATTLASWFRITTGAPLKMQLAGWLLDSLAVLSRSSQQPIDISLEPFDVLLAANRWLPVSALGMIKKARRGTELIEDFGKRGKVYYSHPLDQETFDFFLSVLRENPDGAGIAHVVEVALDSDTLREYRDRLPALAEKSNVPDHCRASIAALNAVSGKYSDAKQLGCLIAKEFARAAARIANLLVPPYRTCDEQLLLVLNEELPRDSWYSRFSVRRVLENLQKSKPGPERGREFWRELGFSPLNLT